MNKVTYTTRKRFVKYDDNQFILYLNEEIIPNYVQDNQDGEALAPVTGYAYTGEFGDGGTLINASEASYDAFVSGLIRLKYSADKVEAITLNMLSENKERRNEFEKEFAELEAYRQVCKVHADSVLNR